MLLVSPRNSAAGTRYRFHLRMPTNPAKASQASHLRCGFKSTGGRSRLGHKTIWSKGGRAQRRSYTCALEGPEGGRTLGLVCGIYWQTHTRLSLALVRNATGAWYFSPSGEGLQPLSYFGTTACHTLTRLTRGEHPSWWWPVSLLPPYTRAALLPQAKGGRAVIARAPGSTALVLTAHLWENWALLVMPSGQLAVAPNEAHVILGGASPTARMGASCLKAGLRHRLGLSPRVRGVAMNPNDHPHGGRTKSVKYPMTPWGRTTRYPRPRRPKLKLKALSKRRPKRA